MELIEKAMRWLFPDYYAETAVCENCGATVCKSRMLHDLGWFCNDECADEDWWNTHT